MMHISIYDSPFTCMSTTVRSYHFMLIWIFEFSAFYLLRSEKKNIALIFLLFRFQQQFCMWGAM